MCPGPGCLFASAPRKLQLAGQVRGSFARDILVAVRLDRARHVQMLPRASCRCCAGVESRVGSGQAGLASGHAVGHPRAGLASFTLDGHCRIQKRPFHVLTVYCAEGWGVEMDGQLLRAAHSKLTGRTVEGATSGSTVRPKSSAYGEVPWDDETRCACKRRWV
jgi:hypothetical protein